MSRLVIVMVILFYVIATVHLIIHIMGSSIHLTSANKDISHGVSFVYRVTVRINLHNIILHKII